MVIEVVGSRSQIIHRPRPEDDPRQRQPDISKAQNVLSWRPQTPLKEGLVRTIEYFEKLLSDQGIQAVALIAYEIAQQLRAQGQEVALLVLFDAVTSAG